LPKRKFGIWPPLISLGFFGSEKSNLHRFKYSELSSDSATYSPAPPLIGVIGRPVADTSFDYSDTMVAMEGIWTPERLYPFIFRPMLTAPGTKMFWPPELTPEQVADVIAYFVSVAE
jgi:cytochrome c2